VASAASAPTGWRVGSRWLIEEIASWSNSYSEEICLAAHDALSSATGSPKDQPVR